MRSPSHGKVQKLDLGAVDQLEYVCFIVLLRRRIFCFYCNFVNASKSSWKYSLSLVRPVFLS